MTSPTNEPPYNLDTEIALLGACLRTPAEALAAAEEVGLRTSDFYAERHGLVYDTIKYLHERGAVDELAVINELKARRKLTAAGGSGYIMSYDCPFTGNARAYADEIVDQAILRSMVETGAEITRLGMDHPDKVKTLVERCSGLTETMVRNSQRVNGVIGDAA